MAKRKHSEYKYWADGRYWFMGAFQGSLTWVCDNCGHGQTTQMRFGQFRLKCGQCRRALIWCFTLKPMEKTRRKDVVPRDMMPELGPVLADRPLGFGPAAPVHEVMAQDEE